MQAEQDESDSKVPWSRRLPLALRVIALDRAEIFRRQRFAYVAYLAVSALTGAFIAWSDPKDLVFTHSLLQVGLFALLGSLSALGGCFLCAGYAVTHFLVPNHVGRSLGNLHLYFVLFLLAVSLPLTARNVAGLIPRKSYGRAWFLRLREALALLVALFLGIFWSQSAPLLVRPFFTFHDRTPSVGSIAPIQTHPWVVGGLLLVAVLARLFLDNLVTEEHDDFSGVVPASSKGRWPWARLVARVSLFAFFTAGIVESFWQFLFYYLALLGVYVIASFVGRVRAYVDVVDGIPVLFRLLALFGLSYFVSYAIIHTRIGGQSFFSLLLSTIACTGFALLMFPKREALREA